jgi:tetratricopeptide (TPR) repeat protein
MWCDEVCVSHMRRGPLFLCALLMAQGPSDATAQRPIPQEVTGSAVEGLLSDADAEMRDGTPEATERAISLFERAVTLEPMNQRALEGLVFAHVRRVDSHREDPVGYDVAVEFARRVIPLDPAQGWHLTGSVLRLKSESESAIDALHRALTFNPDHHPSTLSLGHLYFDLGRHHLAIPVLLRAGGQNPQSRNARNLAGFAYFHLGLPELAEEQFRASDALGRTGFTIGGLLLTQVARGDFAGAITTAEAAWREDGTPAWTWARLGEANLFAGNHEEAARLFAEALQRDSASTNNYTWRSTALPLALLRRRAGKEAEVTQLIARGYAHADALMRRGQEPWNSYYQYAALALLEGDRQQAIRWLRTAHQAGMPGPILIESDPLLEDLRNDVEFQEIVQRLRWRETEMRERLAAP